MKRNFTSLTSKNIHLLLWVGFFLLTIGHLSAQNVCMTMPEPVSYTQVGTPTNKKVTEFTTIRGVRVDRVLEAGNRSIDNIQYATDDNTPDETYCGKDRKTTFKGGNKKYPFMDSNKVKKITYKFSKPVNDIEVFLAAFGYNGTREWWKQNTPHKDVVKFTVNNGGEINLALRSSCTAGAVTISGDVVSSEDKKTTDAKVGISSSTPFTELTLEFLEPSGQTGGYGFFVEICLASIVTPIESSTCTSPIINDPFTTFPNQTVSVAGISITRKVDTGISKAGSFSGSHCGSTKTYPSKDPLLKDSKKIVYEFSTPVKSAEIFLLAFGDNTQVNSFDKAKFEVNGGGAISLSKSYDCNPIVSTINNNVVESVSNRKLTTDVGIKIASSKPFSRITITDMGSTGYGYLVALCPTSIVKATDDDIFTIDKTLTAQSVCEDAMTGVPPSYQAQATSKFNGGSFKYELQAKKSGSSSWLTIATQDNKTSGTNINFVEANLGTLPYDQANIRVKYTYKNPSEFSEEIVRYSNVATLTVSEAKVTKLTATPLSITQGITTNVAYRIEGTSNATVTYQVNGGTPQTVGLNNSGVATVTLPTSQATTFKITRVQKGACNITQNKQVQVTAAFNNGLCTTKPNSLFTTTNDATYTINNITVTRSYVGGTTPNNFLTSSLNDPTEYCSVYPANSNYPWLQKANNRITSVTYKFSQPVNNVEVWLLIMGKGAVGTVDKAKFSINAGCGNPTLSLVADCKGTATINGTTVSENNLIGTDLAVKVTATKPFTELTITDDNSTAGGFLVELCPASIKKQGTGNTDAVTISTQLTATTTACVGFTTTLTTQATLASPFSGSLSYQWQKSTNNGTTWSDISGQSGSATSGANVTYSFTPTTSDNNALYRVAYTYTHAGSFCGTLSLTTNATKLVANTVSSVIAINTPAYTDVAVCATTTGTTTITAKATLNTGMGGTGVTYQLQYRPTDTANWVDHATQKYTLVTGGAEKILTIANVASNTGYYRVKYTSDASVCGGGESYSNIFKFDALTATNVITINPATYPNKTVCSGSSFTINAQATVATGNIANDGSGNKFAYELQYKANSSANWVLYTLPNGGAAQIYSNNTKVGATRTFNISTENIATGGKFRVKYSADITDLCDDITVYSDEFTVTIDELDVTNITATPPVFKQGENTSVSFVIEGTPGAQVTFKVGNGAEQTQTLNAAGKYNVPPQTTNQTLELSVTKVKKGTCEKTYTDKKGRAQATTAACTTKPAIQYPAPVGQGQTAVMNGVTVTRKFSGTPSIYGNSDTGTYCSGTVYHHYTIIHNNLPAQFSNAVTYVFSKPVTSTEVWLMVMSSPATGSYDEVQLTTNNGNLTFTKIYDCLGGAGAVTLSPSGRVTSKPEKVNDVAIRVSSDKPFTELTITDVRATGGTSGVLVELCPTSVTPANTITITTQPQNKTICANEMATFTSKAQLQNATGSIQYKWQQSNNGTNWTDIASSQGTITSGATASLTTAGIANYKYRVVYSYKFTADVVVTATSQEVTLTKLPSVALPTLSGNMTLCPTATPNNVSFDNYVTPAVGTTLRWYATPTATASTTVAPTINTNVTTRTTATAYVRAINNNGCTSGLVTVTLTVNDTTPPTFNAPSALNIVCNSTTATTAINTWLGTATATDACGAIATITNNYNAPADFCTVPGGVITVIFVAKDTFGNVTTKTSTIKLAATPLTVASDTFTVGNGVTTQTAGNILTNDNLGGNTPTAGPTGSVTITVVTPATPIGGGKTPTLDVNTGIVTVPAGTKSGTYTITYKECESLNPSSNCQTQTVVISVGSASLTVVPETLTVTPSTSTQTTPSIFDNDSIGGVTTPTAGPGGNVTMTVHNPSGSKVPTMDPNTGKVTVPGNTPAGNYTITYNYCEVLNPTNCTGTRTVVVTVGAATLTVASDTFTVGNGVTTQTAGNILTNDNLGGNTPTAGPTGSVTITVVTPATPIGGGKTPTLDVNTGIVTVPAGTKSGTYTITYKECESLNPSSNCQTQTVVISVGSASLTVVPETLTVTPSTSTQTTPSIFDNDSIGGVTTPTAGPGGNVTMTVHNPSGSKVPTMDPNTGKVTVPGNTPAGNYTITYNYCEVLNPTNCTGTRTVVVTVGAATLTVASDTFTVGNGVTTQTAGNILTNDNLGGNTPTAGPIGSVTITVVTPATPIGGGKTPTLDVNTGIVTVPAGTKSGTYTITYKECESLNPSSNCQTQTVVISVGSASLTVVPETLTVTPSTSTQTTPSIFDNDSIGGVTTPTAGPGGNVTMTVHNPSGSKVPTMDPNTGKVTVPGNTPAGNYTITYNYCEVLNPTNCTGTRTVVVTVGAATLTVASDTFTVGNGVTTQTAGNILTNDNLGGNTPTAGPTGSVTITVVTPATPIGGGKTPTLDVNTGIVTVPAGTKSGTYTITYKECESLNPSSNCQTQTVVISVGSASLTVVPETLTVTPSTSTQTTPSIFDNDSIGGVTTPTAGPGGNVTMTVHNPSGSKVPTMDPNTGKVTVPGNTPAGNYTITYNYCEVLNPTNCTGTRTVVVTVGAATLTVASDTFTVGNGVTTQTAGNILTNDNLGGNTPTAGPTGSVTITVVTPATPIGGGKTPTLDVNTGIVTVPAGTKSGTYTITYKECESLNPSSNCQTQTVVISVGSASLTVVPETLTVTPSTSTQTTPSIFDNDSIGGVTTPTAGPGGNVTMTVHNPSGSKVPTMDPNTGKVTVPGNTPAGNYTITYNYCEVLNPTNCTGTRTVVVTVGAATLTVASDTFTVGNGVTTQTAGNILTNDNLGGNTPTAGPTGSVTITVVTPATPIGGGKTPTLDVNTGIVTVPAGTKSGTYTITYKECESLNPSSNCQTQTVVISVGSASLTVVPETLTVTPSTSTQTTPSIFDNDSIGGVTTPTAGPGGNVTMTVHNPSGSKVPTMDPNTGKVTVPGNTPAGNYTITYNYCEVLNPTNCIGTRTVVVTVGAPELVVPSKVYPLAPGTTSTETVIDTATLGGNPVSSTAVTIAVVTPATSLGGTPTPTLNTTTGKITVPTGTKSGTYNIVYRVCEVLNPSNCKTATATVVVGEVPVITPDNLPIVPSTPTSTTTRTIGNILTNDTVGTQSATAGTGGNVTITITSPITPNTPVIDPTTGNVQIPPTTPPGVYTITYDVCTTATPVACTSGTLTVTVSQPSPIIRPENLTVTQTGTSTTPSILNNDDIVKPDGTTASATGSNVTITNVVVTPGAAPGAPTPTLNPDGTITVPGTLPPGVYTITYDVCTTATPSTCVSGTTVLTVSPTATATPTAGDNTYDVPTSGTATVVGTILSNDTVDGVASATATNVTVSVTTAPTGTGVPTIGSNGSVTVPANAIPGVYTYTYHICSVATPTACSTEATVTVTVRQPVPVLPNNNMVYTDTTTTTAGNITTGGTVGTQSVTTGPTGNVTITVVTPATPQVPGGTVPTLNPDGTVTVPTGTASGTYTITYQVCTTATPTSCVTGVVTITVSPTTVTPTVLPVAVDDRASTAVNTPVNIAVLPNDTLNGATTPNVVTSPANGTVMVNSDNTIEYRPHTGFTGTDTFVYEICNSAGCSSATVTVEVVNKIIPYSGMSVNGDGKNDHFHIGGIENYPNNVVRIYNRWGVKVFEVNGYDNVTRVFRGISDARATVEAADKLPQGTYYYVIEYYDQNNKKQSEVGWLYLKK